MSDAERRILIAFDGSRHAKQALKYYCSRLANAETDNVSVLSVHKRASDADEAAARESMTWAVHRLQSKFPRMRISGIVSHGVAKEHACMIARVESMDLIIVGARGRGAIKRFFLGSTSDFILHHATTSVCVVHRGDHQNTESDSDNSGDDSGDASGDDAEVPRLMLCPVDGSANSDAAFAMALEAAGTRFALMIVTVIQLVTQIPGDDGDPEDPVTKTMLNTLRKRKFDHAEALVKKYEQCAVEAGVAVDAAYVAVGDPRELIVEAAESRNVDTIVLGARGRGAVARMVMGSVSAHVVHHNPGAAVIVVPPVDRPAPELE